MRKGNVLIYVMGFSCVLAVLLVLYLYVSAVASPVGLLRKPRVFLSFQFLQFSVVAVLCYYYLQVIRQVMKMNPQARAKKMVRTAGSELLLIAIFIHVIFTGLVFTYSTGGYVLSDVEYYVFIPVLVLELFVSAHLLSKQYENQKKSRNSTVRTALFGLLAGLGLYTVFLWVI